MLRYYRDIIDRLGPPEWWDENGVPRYDEFEPILTNVYSNYVAFMEIACQLCRKRFNVSVEVSHIGFIHHKMSLPTQENIEHWHYGDPPHHGCVGDTMNCEEVRIIEFWQRDKETGFNWERLPEHEISNPNYN